MESVKNIVSGTVETTDEIAKEVIYMCKIPMENVKDEDGEGDIFETVTRIKKLTPEDVQGQLRYVGYEVGDEDNIYINVISKIKAVSNCTHALFDGDKLIINFNKEKALELKNTLTELPADTKYRSLFDN